MKIAESHSRNIKQSCLMQVFCVSIVIYEIYIGTEKYLSNPVANVVYTLQTELPMLTVCPEAVRNFVPPRHILDGEYYPDDKGRFFKI